MEDFFQAYQETPVKPGLPCFYSEVGDFNQAYQEIWLNQAYNGYKPDLPENPEIFNQVYQESLVISD